MTFTILNVGIRFEQDVVQCRQRARQIAGLLGFDAQDQTRIATAVSEIARNAFRYAGGGKATFAVIGHEEAVFQIRIQDQGKGISKLEEILSGRYESKTGMGLGIIGAKRLMDEFSIESMPGEGTRAVFGKRIPRKFEPGPNEMARIADELAKRPAQDAYDEVRQQNAELVQAMQALEEREAQLKVQRDQLRWLNQELADTNRGVVALNKELEDKATAVKVASEAKSRFLSHITHEIRTPVNSILSLTRLLLTPSERDPVSAERQQQIQFIRKAAENLSVMINDLLDTAKLDAGRLEVHPGEVDVEELFGSLRAMFRPLLSADHPVDLIFEIQGKIQHLYSDEVKIAQILRNFISNALKFTPKGQVKVVAKKINDQMVELSVSDTGIGIAAKDLERIFEEFTQVQGPLQRRAKGTGLGLPLARRLAELLGGTVHVISTEEEGSTFVARLPLRLQTVDETSPGETADPSRPAIVILIIDDDEIARYLVAELLKDSGYALLEASGGKEGLKRAHEHPPQAIVLDLRMPDMSGFEVLEELKKDPLTKDIPIIINSSKPVRMEDFGEIMGRPAAILDKGLPREEAQARIRDALQRAGLIDTSVKESRLL